jgi:hypothetical protein
MKAMAEKGAVPKGGIEPSPIVVENIRVLPVFPTPSGQVWEFLFASCFRCRETQPLKIQPVGCESATFSHPRLIQALPGARNLQREGSYRDS